MGKAKQIAIFAGSVMAVVAVTYWFQKNVKPIPVVGGYLPGGW